MYSVRRRHLSKQLRQCLVQFVRRGFVFNGRRRHRTNCLHPLRCWHLPISLRLLLRSLVHWLPLGHLLGSSWSGLLGQLRKLPEWLFPICNGLKKLRSLLSGHILRGVRGFEFLELRRLRGRSVLCFWRWIVHKLCSRVIFLAFSCGLYRLPLGFVLAFGRGRVYELPVGVVLRLRRHHRVHAVHPGESRGDFGRTVSGGVRLVRCGQVSSRRGINHVHLLPRGQTLGP